jgi:hypothetical protein
VCSLCMSRLDTDTVGSASANATFQMATRARLVLDPDLWRYHVITVKNQILLHLITHVNSGTQ